MKSLLTLFSAFMLIITSPAHADKNDVTQQLTNTVNWFLDGASVNDAEIHDKFWAEELVYTSSNGTFTGWTTNHLELVDGKAPLYPGISSNASSGNLTADQVIAQILIARRLGAKGFVIFNYSRYFSESILPQLHKGVTADPDGSGLLLR